MSSFYSVFGLSLITNRPIPGLVPLSETSSADIRISLDDARRQPGRPLHPEELWYVSDERDGQAPALRVWRVADGAYFRLAYSDGTEFLVDRAGREVRAAWPDSSTLEDTSIYLLGPVLGFVLRLRGMTCLHASAVAAGDRAIALVGCANAGKSTAAAAFCRMGYPVLADDIVALSERDGAFHVQPAYPQLRLWPDAVCFLYGSADALPPLTPTWDKRALDLSQNGCRFQQHPLPLGAIYVLAGRSSDAALCMESLRGRERLLPLLANTYVSYLLDASMRAREFASLGRLVSSVPVRRVVPPADPGQLTRLCDRILDDYEGLGCTASPITAR
ncbi:MAG: serine/threonine protein kinase [Vicinamibacterales bacterium]